MKKIRKKAAAAISGLMILSLLAGCGNNAISESSQTTVTADQPAGSAGTAGSEAAAVSPAGEFPIVQDKITLKVAAIDETYVGALGDVDFVKWYEEKTNIHIEWVEIPRDGYKEKLNLMLTTGNLPDIILGMKLPSADTSAYGEDGTFLMLDNYIEEYGVEIKRMMAENELIKDSITATDGHIYNLPLINDCLHNQYRTRAWINRDWLDAVGMEMPATTEEFEAVLQAFKDQDPNGNGIADEIPMLGNNLPKNNIITYLMNAFIIMNGSDIQDPTTMYLYMNQGKIDFTPDKEAYRDGLKWINSLVEKGLIDATSFTQDDTQFKQVIQNEDAVQVGVVRADLICSYMGEYMGTADHRIEQYKILPPLEGPEGVRNQPSYLYASIGAGNFIITSSCKYPEAAFRWADGWYTEEATLFSWYGLEGSGWAAADEGSIGLNGEPALYQRLPVEGAEQTIRLTNKFGNNTARLREGEQYEESIPEMKYAVEPILYFATRDTLVQYADPTLTVPPLTLTREEVAEISNIRTMINDYVEENMAVFALGARDIDKEWDAYVKEFSVLGLDRMLEVYQTAYERQYQ